MRVCFVVLAAAVAVAMSLRVSAAEAAGETLAYDVSWPQCGAPLPAPPFEHAVVGVDDGKAFTRNPCFREQFQWATISGTPSLYMTLRQPGSGAARGANGPGGVCAPTDVHCVAYNYGANAALEAIAYAESEVAVPPTTMWWLDIETISSWSTQTSINAAVITGAIDVFRSRGTALGVYSTAYQWRTIAGALQHGLPTWVAGATGAGDAEQFCTAPEKTFGGGTAWFVQYVEGKFDHNYICPAARLPLPAKQTASDTGREGIATPEPTANRTAPQGQPAAPGAWLNALMRGMSGASNGKSAPNLAFDAGRAVAQPTSGEE
jgi:hypothetical protein